MAIAVTSDPDRRRVTSARSHPSSTVKRVTAAKEGDMPLEGTAIMLGVDDLARSKALYAGASDRDDRRR